MPKRVYLKPLSIVRKAGIHTAYVGTNPNGSPIVPPGAEAGELLKLQFVGGVAQNVDDRLFERFKDVGVASLDRPRIVSPYEEEDYAS